MTVESIKQWGYLTTSDSCYSKSSSVINASIFAGLATNNLFFPKQSVLLITRSLGLSEFV